VSDHPNLASALVAALADLTVVGKGRTANAGSYSYDYAALEDVVKDTRPVLADHGVVALTPLTHLGESPAVDVVLMHESGEEKQFGPFPFQHGRDAQATGSMVTYMRRYALLAALGMATGEDDDGASAVAREHAQPVDGPVSQEWANTLVFRCEERGVDSAEVVRRGTDGRTSDPAEVLRSESRSVKAALDALTPAEASA
jgi:hypothetical protein